MDLAWAIERLVDAFASLMGRPASKTAVVKLENLSTALRSWVKVVEWIPDPPGGILKQVAVTQDPSARYKLVIEDTEKFSDKTLSANLNLDFDRMEVGPKPVRIEVRSVDGTTITVDGLIAGEQRLKARRKRDSPIPDAAS